MCRDDKLIIRSIGRVIIKNLYGMPKDNYLVVFSYVEVRL